MSLSGVEKEKAQGAIICLKSAPDVFVPPNWTIDEIRRAIPPHLFERKTSFGLWYFIRDLGMATLSLCLALRIDSFFDGLITQGVPGLYVEFFRWSTWSTYWFFQSLILMGLWVIGHECGHGALSPSKLVCDTVGYVAHTIVWTPYFSWRQSHHIHHIHHASMEKDDTYVPKTRSELSLPPKDVAFDYEDLLGDAPLYNLLALVAQQLFGFPSYFFCHVTGQWLHWQRLKTHPGSSQYLTQSQVRAIIISDIGIAAMAYVICKAAERWGGGTVLKLYGIPWLLVSHWFVALTYLQHTDATIPRYRRGQWTFARGAASTIDRDFLGAYGRFFLHGAAHYHVVHHFFPKLPFYHAEEATVHLKAFLGEHYHRSDTPLLQALWETWNTCIFVEDDEDVLFFRDRQGNSVMKVLQNTST